MVVRRGKEGGGKIGDLKDVCVCVRVCCGINQKWKRVTEKKAFSLSLFPMLTAAVAPPFPPK